MVTVETRAGHSYRGAVETVEDSMNLGLREVTATAPDGAVAQLDRVFILFESSLFLSAADWSSTNDFMLPGSSPVYVAQFVFAVDGAGP